MRICKCGNVLADWEIFNCSDCKIKEERDAILFAIGMIIIVFLFILSSRVLWAKWIYGDLRCAIVECRIMKY